jgi:peptidoglycan/xylan/chitin deacetylase (PgdA/CDA1 family)
MIRAQATRLGATLYYGGLRRLGLPAVRRRCGDAAVVLCYHNVVGNGDSPDGAPGLHVAIERFERQVRWLARHYTVVPLRDFFVQRRAGMSPPLAAITFDDGYDGVFEHAAPLLERLGIPATVFVVADAPERLSGFWWDQPEVIKALTPDRRERWLQQQKGDGAAILAEIQASRVAMLPAAYRPANWATIRAHARGVIDVGVHSATHRSLPTLTDGELDHEVVESRATIHRETGLWPEFFAYPYGSFDARVRDAVRSAGYRAAFALEARGRKAVDRWAVRRVNVPSGISDSAFEAWTAGLH